MRMPFRWHAFPLTNQHVAVLQCAGVREGIYVCVCVCEQVSRGGVLSVNLFMRSLALSHAAPLAVAVKLLSIGTVCQIQWLHVYKNICPINLT